jgi:ubiquinone/menaquinone biosynthesis C-methylase UbiE
MECLAGNAAITSYVGIEPNVHMHEIFYNKTKALPDIGFPIELKTLEGEALGLADESFDTVIFTHVLCSVRNSTQVLEEVNRVLKPHGTVYFMEHIASPEGTGMRRFQKFIEPVWSFFLGGCRFEDSHHDLDKLKDRFLVHYEFFDAPMPILFVKPHLIGHAVKKGVPAEQE